MYNPKLIGFQHAIQPRSLRSSEKIESSARIGLRAQVQIYVSEKSNFVWADSSARKVYVELSGQEGMYGVSNVKKSFEIW